MAARRVPATGAESRAPASLRMPNNASMRLAALLAALGGRHNGCRAGHATAIGPRDRRQGGDGHPRLYRQPRALRRRRLCACVGAVARCEDARGIRAPHWRLRQDAAQGHVDPQRGLGPHQLGDRSPHARLDRFGHARQPGLDQPARWAHEPRQQRGARGGQARSKHQGCCRRRDRARCPRRADRDLQGQRTVARECGGAVAQRGRSGPRARRRDDVRRRARRDERASHGRLGRTGDRPARA